MKNPSGLDGAAFIARMADPPMYANDGEYWQNFRTEIAASNARRTQMDLENLWWRLILTVKTCGGDAATQNRLVGLVDDAKHRGTMQRRISDSSGNATEEAVSNPEGRHFST